MQTDSITWKARARVIKYNPETIIALTAELGHEPTGPELRYLESIGFIRPDEIVDIEGNAVVDVGKQRLGDLITGSGQAFTTARGVIGVGTSTSSTTGGMTALQGGSQLYKGLDGAPTSVVGLITSAATFTGSEANFAWEEWCLAAATAAPVTNSSFATATTSGTMLNRKAQSMGTKVSPAVWTLQTQVQVS